MMRIRFGLILKMTERTKSYAPFNLQYFTKQPDSRAKLSLFSGFHPNYFQKHEPPSDWAAARVHFVISL